MVLMLGVCKALKVMHGYRVQGGPGGANSQRKATMARREAAEAREEGEAEAGLLRRQKGREVDAESEQQEPLMEGEVARSQEGISPGEIRAYAHRDIKPGKLVLRFLQKETT